MDAENVSATFRQLTFLRQAGPRLAADGLREAAERITGLPNFDKNTDSTRDFVLANEWNTICTGIHEVQDAFVDFQSLRSAGQDRLTLVLPGA